MARRPRASGGRGQSARSRTRRREQNSWRHGAPAASTLTLSEVTKLMATKPQMLQGYRVLDFTQFVAGPTCTRVLAEMGAEVIKVELAPAGDRVRSGGLKPLSPENKDSSQSSYYFQHNHSKLSLAVDINKPGARELIYSMIPKIDVVVENYAPGIIKKMGFGYDELRKRNPKIIMCSISALGQSGPLAYKVGYDYMGQAYAAITDGVGETDRPPAIFTMAIGD